MLYNIYSGAIWWQIQDFLCNGNSNMCSISNWLQDDSQIMNNAKTFNLKMKDKE